MFKYQKFLPILLAILIALTGNGCLKKPTKNPSDFGGINIMFTIGDRATLTQKALSDDIQSIKISLVHKNKKISQVQQIPFTGSNQQISFDSLYPGEWQISAMAIDREDDMIFEGSVNTIIQSGNVNQVQLPILPAPGVLDISLDASKIPGYGVDFTKGTLYIYFNPESSESKSYTLNMDGPLLKTTVSISEGSYQIKVAAPNVSSSVYTSPYYTINIRAGKTTSLSINPSCSLAVTGQINSTPATPSLNASYLKESSTVSLSWSQVMENDLAGYRLYRTDYEGRLVRLMIFSSATASYTDTVKDDNFFQGTLGYAISSYDFSGSESLWSPTAVVKNE